MYRCVMKRESNVIAVTLARVSFKLKCIDEGEEESGENRNDLKPNRALRSGVRPLAVVTLPLLTQFEAIIPAAEWATNEIAVLFFSD